MAEKTVKEELEARSDDELIVQAREFHELIYVTECFSTKDMLLLELTYKELERRGFKIKVKRHLLITKKK